MVVQNIEYDNHFKKIFKKIKDPILKIKVKKQIEKILETPEIGKPMQYGRKGTRKLYIKPLRLSYTYIREEDKVIFLDLYHKDEQ